MDNETKTTVVGFGIIAIILLILIGGEVVVRWLLSPTGWNFR